MNDPIERKNAIEAAKRLLDYYGTNDITKEFADYVSTNVMEQIPSAQQEIIRCEECKWKQGSECVRFSDVRPFPDDFCSRAERKDNG